MEHYLSGIFRRRLGRVLAAAVLCACCGAWSTDAWGADGPKQAAAQVLDSGRRAFNEGRFDVAADRFREFIKNFSSHGDVPAARLGLGLALLSQHNGDLNTAVTELTAASGAAFEQRPLATYYLAVAERTHAAASKPVSEERRRSAIAHFEQAAEQFRQRARSGAATAAEDAEWALRAALDQAELLMRTENAAQAKAAAQLLQPVMNEASTRKSKLYPRALYLFGYAQLHARDYVSAGRALAQLAPFDHPDVGLPARYLLARVHHLSGERPEALALYKVVETEFQAVRKRAADALRDAGKLSRADKAHYESIVSGTPEYVQRAALYQGQLLAQAGKNAEAQDVLVKLVRSNGPAGLVQEAQLWQGLCQLQAKNYSEAAQLLEPIVKSERLGDQARWWAARARALAADPSNAQAYVQALQQPIENMKSAAERAGQLAKAGDADARLRRADILLDLADTQQMARQYKAAADTYGALATEFATAAPDRAEQAAERRVTALHLAGDYAGSDAAAQKFEASYPKSTLLAGVAFRAAENAYLPAIADEAGSKPQTAVLLETAMKRFDRVITTYPDFQNANVARAGKGMCLYRLGKFSEAAEVLSQVPEAERQGQLASVNHVLGDCLLRGLPVQTDDALTASRLLEDAGRASKFLVAFAASNEKHPQAGEAVLKAGLCARRMAGVLADPAERRRHLTQAREMFDRAFNMLPKDSALVPVALLERASTLALLGDPAAAMNDLRQFERNEKLKASPNAPLAALRLASMLRATGKAADAAEMLRVLREQQEAALAKDATRAAWVPALAYEHALAMKESGKFAEARAMFDALAKQSSDKAEGVNARWRSAQCRREEVAAKLLQARGVAGRGGVKPEEITAATQQVGESLAALRQAAEGILSEADALSRKPPAAAPDAAAQLLYEGTWAIRTIAEAEIDAARAKMQSERLARLAPKAPNRAAVRAPEVTLRDIPEQPSEARVRELYARVIAAAPDSDLAVTARYELADLLAQRGNADAALEHLADALERNPAEELAERIRIRMAACYLMRGDETSVRNALAQARTVLKNSRSPVRGEAYYYAGEAYTGLKEWQPAAEALSSIRDNSSFANIPGISDKTLLRLAHVQRELGKNDDARNTLEQLVQRYPNSPWLDEARFQAGQLHHTQKNYDAAVNAYGEITRRTVMPIAARAQLQIGLIRLEQKNYKDAATSLLAVSLTYDYPEITSQALVEAARAYVELKQPDEARKLLAEVVRTAPNTPWASLAEKRLSEIQ